jgi:hypothetical protein
MDPSDDDRTLAQYKRAYQRTDQLKPDMLEIAQRRLREGVGNQELAEATGLTPEFFRKLARKIGADNRKRPATVGKEAEARRAAAPRPEHLPADD